MQLCSWDNYAFLGSGHWLWLPFRSRSGATYYACPHELDGLWNLNVQWEETATATATGWNYKCIFPSIWKEMDYSNKTPTATQPHSCAPVLCAKPSHPLAPAPRPHHWEWTRQVCPSSEISVVGRSDINVVSSLRNFPGNIYSLFT